MIRSMTAFSRMEHSSPWGTLIWELRSVNHRFLEISPRLPDSLREIEPSIREIIRQQIQRGKLECHLRLKLEASQGQHVEINTHLVTQLLEASQKIRAVTGGSDNVSLEALLSWPGVIRAAETESAVIQQAALELLQTTLNDLVAHREREGAALADVILDRLSQIEAHVATIRTELPGILQAQRNRLENRLQELSASLDQDRIEQELVIIAQKSDVAEELDRLITHVEEVRHTMESGGAIGRRLDFLMQELNREANTLGSKSINSLTSQAAVELKVLIEQMREQIQNIE